MKSNFLRVKYRIAACAGAFILIAGLPLAFVSSPVFAYETYGWCTPVGSYNACLNAWNGGPWVNTYDSPYTNNSYFTNVAAGSGNVELEDEGLNSYDGTCIGDAYNDSGLADSTLDECPTSGDAGWGTNFHEYSCYVNGNPGYEFHNNHWNGWLKPQGSSNGQEFYLNSASPYCYAYYPAYLQ